MKIEEAYPKAYELAKRFHEFYELSAPLFGYETRMETKKFDPESPNGRLMARVCFEIVKEEKQKFFKEINEWHEKNGYANGTWIEARKVFEEES